MVQIFDEIKQKAQLMKPIITKVFKSISAFSFIEPEQVVLGFFYFYVYKDFVLRELIFWFGGSDEGNIIDPN